MRQTTLAAGFWLALAAPAPAQNTSAEYKKAPGPHEVAVSTFDWQDAKRDRAVPAKVYAPKSGGPYPVIVFSHGLGGSRDGYEYLGRHWASHGYVSVHLQHKGSDTAVWQGQANPLTSLRQAAADPRNAIDRGLDVRFALDQLDRLNREDSPLKGRLDLGRVGMAGHSFGAATTLMAAGQVFVRPGGPELSLGDPRIKAAIPMSTAPARDKSSWAKAYGAIKVPCLHMTGTRDDSPISDTKAADRRTAYDHCSGSEQYLVIFEGGDHMVFAGPRTRPDPRDARILDLIRMSTTAFWDAYLRGDEPAQRWLAVDFKEVLGKDGTFESKKPGGSN